MFVEVCPMLVKFASFQKYLRYCRTRCVIGAWYTEYNGTTFATISQILLVSVGLQATSYEPIFVMLDMILPKLDYMRMLFSL